jgi:hypothetical protein
MLSVFAITVLSIVTGMPSGSVSLTQIMPSEIDHGLASVGLNRSYSSIWWPVPTKNSIDYKKRLVHRCIKVSRGFRSERGLQI